jgi:hypothetical protein
MDVATPPRTAELTALALDVLVRRYPELLAPLRREGLDPSEDLAPLDARLDPERLGAVRGILAERTAWRRR